MRLYALSQVRLPKSEAIGEALYHQGRTKEGEKFPSESFREVSADISPGVREEEQARERFVRFVVKIPRKDNPSSFLSQEFYGCLASVNHNGAPLSFVANYGLSDVRTPTSMERADQQTGV